MRKVIFTILFVALLFVAREAKAETLNGASFIGMCSANFPCARALKAFRGSSTKAVGYLADAFGYQCECVKRFLALQGPKYIRVHLANGTCFPERGRVCSRFDVFRKKTLKATERDILQKNKRVLARYRASIERTIKLLSVADSETTLRYSLCLECPLSNRARRVLLEEALKYIPEEQLVDSVLTQRCLKGLICEKHGEAPRFSPGARCIADTDGIAFTQSDLEKYRAASAQCEARFYWSYGFNLLDPKALGGFIPPYRREAQATDWELGALSSCVSGGC